MGGQRSHRLSRWKRQACGHIQVQLFRRKNCFLICYLELTLMVTIFCPSWTAGLIGVIGSQVRSFQLLFQLKIEASDARNQNICDKDHQSHHGKCWTRKLLLNRVSSSFARLQMDSWLLRRLCCKSYLPVFMEGRRALTPTLEIKVVNVDEENTKNGERRAVWGPNVNLIGGKAGDQGYPGQEKLLESQGSLHQ